MGWNEIYILFHQSPSGWKDPMGAPSQLAELSFVAPSEGQVDLILRGNMFQRVGATAEKVLLLEPTSCNSLTNGVHSIPLCWSEWGRSIPLGWYFMGFDPLSFWWGGGGMSKANMFSNIQGYWKTLPCQHNVEFWSNSVGGKYHSRNVNICSSCFQSVGEWHRPGSICLRRFHQ